MSPRFLGFTPASSAAMTNALPALKESMVAIHFGMAGSSPSAGRLRHCLTASARNSKPRIALMAKDAAVGSPPAATFPALAASNTREPTTLSARTHPAANAIPFARALALNSMRMTAMIGTGLIATATACGRISPMTLLRLTCIPPSLGSTTGYCPQHALYLRRYRGTRVVAPRGCRLLGDESHDLARFALLAEQLRHRPHVAVGMPEEELQSLAQPVEPRLAVRRERGGSWRSPLHAKRYSRSRAVLAQRLAFRLAERTASPAHQLADRRLRHVASRNSVLHEVVARVDVPVVPQTTALAARQPQYATARSPRR